MAAAVAAAVAEDADRLAALDCHRSGRGTVTGSNGGRPRHAEIVAVMQSLAATLETVTEEALREIPKTSVSFAVKVPDGAPVHIEGTVVVAFRDEAARVPAMLAEWFGLVERIPPPRRGSRTGSTGCDLGQFVFVVAEHHKPLGTSGHIGIPSTFAVHVHSSFGR